MGLFQVPVQSLREVKAGTQAESHMHSQEKRKWMHKYLVFGPLSLLLQSKMEAHRMVHHNVWVFPPQLKQSRQSPTNMLLGQPNGDKPPSRLSSIVILQCVKLTI